jgi:DNA-binding transcriptional ArsR family regulator
MHQLRDEGRWHSADCEQREILRTEMSDGGLDVLTIDKPEQLKALGHPLRLRVLEELGESGARLTNRELAARLGVDPGHLHFHVKMLLSAGLIELADGDSTGREKPYKAVAPHVRVAPELIASGAANDSIAAMLDGVQRNWGRWSSEGRFRAAQMTVRIDPERVRDLFRMLVVEAEKIEDSSLDPIVVTVFSHPHSSKK